ncbi:MAG TPA: hypothetical protein VFM10_02845 [Terriglobales bacterium]|nr:hypothetical protein [Terriglobales bacterium]
MPTSKVTLAKRVAELERQIADMREVIAAQQRASSTAAAPAKAVASAAAVEAAVTASPAPSSVKVAPTPAPKLVQTEQLQEGISPEVLAVIAAAVVHFVGKGARIRSARLIHPVGTSPWAQQGRVFVQASHNLAMTR